MANKYRAGMTNLFQQGCGIGDCQLKMFGSNLVGDLAGFGEIAYVEKKANRWERYAARFAAKEAGMKAIGTGWRRGVRWVDFEVVNEPSGKPTLLFHGKAKEFADSLGINNVALSLTHTATQGVAFLVIEKNQ